MLILHGKKYDKVHARAAVAQSWRKLLKHNVFSMIAFRVHPESLKNQDFPEAPNDSKGAPGAQGLSRAIGGSQGLPRP
eukprot:6927800-Pyramimonas_sp.AAC.1